MPIGHKNDGGVSMLRRTNIADIYSKAKGLFTKMWLLYYSKTKLLGLLIVGQVARPSSEKRGEQVNNEHRSALP
jgi:hypothetical protein